MQHPLLPLTQNDPFTRQKDLDTKAEQMPSLTHCEVKKNALTFFPTKKITYFPTKKRCRKLYKGSWCILLLSIRGKSKPNAKTTGEYKDLMLVLLLMRVIFSFFTCYGTYWYLYVFFF